MNTEHMIFVFGSNLSGIHGAGAARFAAVHKGAIYGQGEGLQGASYALPTKGFRLHFMPLEDIQGHVIKFITFAAMHPELKFQVTMVGCGLSGFKPSEIAPMFAEACYPGSNCFFDKLWIPWLPKDAQFWGTAV
jgi:hypothetical protein